jgi:GNAT superfamily N-acetyltransferase
LFAKYHYLNHSISPAAQCYLGLLNDKPVAFLAVIHFPHPKRKNLKKVHRLVVLPDYQGFGIGLNFLNFIADFYKNKNYAFGITTSQPALNHALKKSDKWVLIRYGRMVNQNKLSLNRSNSNNRLTASWFYK